MDTHTLIKGSVKSLATLGTVALLMTACVSIGNQQILNDEAIAKVTVGSTKAHVKHAIGEPS